MNTSEDKNDVEKAIERLKLNLKSFLPTKYEKVNGNLVPSVFVESNIAICLSNIIMNKN